MIAHRLLLAAGILAAVMLGSLPAIAADWKPFTQAEFNAAQKEGKPILVDIFAPWCPTCRAAEADPRGAHRQARVQGSRGARGRFRPLNG